MANIHAQLELLQSQHRNLAPRRASWFPPTNGSALEATSATNCWIGCVVRHGGGCIIETPCLHYELYQAGVCFIFLFVSLIIFNNSWGKGFEFAWKCQIILNMSQPLLLPLKNQHLGELDFTIKPYNLVKQKTHAGHYRSIHFHDTNTGETSKSAKVFFWFGERGERLSVFQFCLWQL